MVGSADTEFISSVGHEAFRNTVEFCPIVIFETESHSEAQAGLKLTSLPSRVLGLQAYTTVLS